MPPDYAATDSRGIIPWLFCSAYLPVHVLKNRPFEPPSQHEVAACTRLGAIRLLIVALSGVAVSSTSLVLQ